MAARCSASLSYFQVDIFTGRRVGRYIDLYMGGVMLEFVTALMQRASESIFLLLFEEFGDIFWLFPSGL